MLPYIESYRILKISYSWIHGLSFHSEVAKTLDIIVDNRENVGLNAKSGSDSKSP